jgi:hypothetical protein
MCAIPVILLAVWGTWALPRHSPNQVIRIAVAAIVGGSICIGIAMFTGNLALYYLGSLAAPYGLLLLLLAATLVEDVGDTELGDGGWARVAAVVGGATSSRFRGW